MKTQLIASICREAFVFMIKQATVADARTAGLTIEFIAVANLVSALGAFYCSIDHLKHRKSQSSESPLANMHIFATTAPAA